MQRKDKLKTPSNKETREIPDKPQTSILIKNNKIIYNGSFEVDLDRFSDVISQMIPIYRENEQLYKDKFLFPEYVFENYFF